MPSGTLRRIWSSSTAAVVLVLSLNGCGDGTPNAPTNSSVTIPTLSSPPDDAVAAGAPSLTVNNVSSARGTRTYDFQVAENEAALSGPVEALFASAAGVPEGAGGRTSYQVTRSLQPGRRYYWRARATQDGTAGAWSSAFRFRTEAGANPPPVIRSMTVGSRAEVNADLDVSADVTDQETNPASLGYEWTASAGRFTGTGARVRWTAPSTSPSTAPILTLTVIERYAVAVAGGGEETRENRASANATVHVNDSAREITTLVTTFFDDFVHSERTPEFCVRNFSDSCPGKQAELNDIRENRRLFIVDPVGSRLGTPAITFYDTGAVSRRRPVPANESAFSEVLVPCTFASTARSTGVYGLAIGTCQLTTVYENWQWRLCDSHFLPRSTLSGIWSRFRF